MTFPNPTQLLRQAADKELLATNLTRYAKALEGVFVGGLANPQTVDAFWKGPASGRFNIQAAQMGRELKILREDCVATAEHLRKQAELLRTEAAQLPG